jgi:hypothetical protein
MPGITLYDTTTGKPAQLSPDEAIRALQDGTHSVPRDRLVPVMDPDTHRIVNVRGEHLHQAIAADMRPVTEEEAAAAAKEKRAEGDWTAQHPLVSAALGIHPQQRAMQEAMLSGATAGAAPAAVHGALGLVSPEYAQAYAQSEQALQEDYPKTTAAGQIAGAAVGAYAGGALGGAARLLPSAAFDIAGGAAEGAIARATGGLASSGLGGEIGAAALRLGANGAVQGALYGAAQQVSDDLIQDHELAADKLFAASANGLLFGGLTGAGFGALGAGGAAALRGARGMLAPLQKGAASAAEAGEAAANVVRAAGLEPEQEASVLRSLPKKLAKMDAGEMAGEEAWKAASPGKKQTLEAEARAGGTAEVGKTVLKYRIIDADRGVVNALAEGHPEQLLKRTEAAMDLVGEKIGEVLGPSGATIRAGDVLEPIQAKMQALSETAASSYAVDGLREFHDRVVRSLDLPKTAAGAPDVDALIPIQKLVAERRALQQMTFQDNQTLDAKLALEVRRDVSRAWGDIEEKALDGAAKELGHGPTGEDLRALNRDYQHLALYKQAIEKGGVMRAETNRKLSLTDMLTVGGGIAAGHPVAGFALGFAHKVIRERGNAAAAVLLSRVAEMKAIEGVMTRIDRVVNRAAEDAVAGTAEARTPMRRPRPKLPPKNEEDQSFDRRYRRAVDAVASMQRDPDAFARRAAAVSDAMPAAPKLSGALSRNVTRAAVFLAQKVPQPVGPMRLGGAPPSVPDTEKAKFLDAYEAIREPEKTIAKIGRGDASVEAVQALRYGAPALFEDFRMKTMRVLADKHARGEEVPFEASLRLGLLLDIPADPSLDPRVMRTLQMNVAGPAPAPQNQQHKGTAPHRPVQLDTQQSPLDRLEAGAGAGRRRAAG